MNPEEENEGVSLQAIAAVIRAGDLPTVMRLLPPDSHYKEAIVGRRRVTAINLAAIEGQLAILKYLVEIGCNIDHADEDGFTCAHLAAWYNHCHVLEYLGTLRPGQLRSRQHGNMPIHVAAYRQMYAAVLTLSRYSDIDRQDAHLNTPLRIFVQRSDVQGVRTCIEAGAKVRNIDVNTVPADRHAPDRTQQNREIRQLLEREKNWSNRKGLIMLIHKGNAGPAVNRLPEALLVELVYFL